jgi:hypothetical protein
MAILKSRSRKGGAPKSAHARAGGHAHTLQDNPLTQRREWSTDPVRRFRGAHMSQHNHYPTMEFPDYEFREYPMMVYPEGNHRGAGVLVRSDEERDHAMGGHKVVRDEDRHARLVKVAHVKGVKVDKRWNSDRIAAAITDAGHDPDLDPDA